MRNDNWKRDFEARLRTIDWSKLKDGCGCYATYLPDAMMSFVEEGKYTNDQNDFFYTDLTHQQSCGPATYRALSFLVELLDHLPGARAFLIEYLVDIELGLSQWHYPMGNRDVPLDENPPPGSDFQLLASAMDEAFPRFMALARQTEDAETHRLALWSLGWFPQREAQSRPILEASSEFAAQFALQMLDAVKLPKSEQERTEDEEMDDIEEYEEILARIYNGE